MTIIFSEYFGLCEQSNVLHLTFYDADAPVFGIRDPEAHFEDQLAIQGAVVVLPSSKSFWDNRERFSSRRNWFVSARAEESTQEETK